MIFYFALDFFFLKQSFEHVYDKKIIFYLL